MRLLSFVLASVLIAPATMAQHQHQHQEVAAGASPYVDLTEREIKALSADEIRDLRAGNGMGFALPAELNGYPGPRHVLELKDKLGLTEQQEGATQEVFNRMQRAAIEAGEQLIASEKDLNDGFVNGTVDPETLGELTGRIGQVRAALRAIHLAAHLEMMEILTEAQIHRYNMARGYHQGH